MKNSDSVEKFVLLVSPEEPDLLALRTILQEERWRVLGAQNPIEARQVLGDAPVDAVIADSQCWKSLLAEMWNRAFPLIVVDRLADDRLWGEVLNLGAFDLLPKPFEAKVVLHVLNSACRLHPGFGFETQPIDLHGCSEGQPAEAQMLTAALAHP